MPKRIQRKRTKGWRMPEGAVSVTRPGIHGNPFTVGLWFRKMTSDWNVWSHGDSSHFGNVQIRDLAHSLEVFSDYAPARAERDPEWLAPLKGKDLACWCKEGSPCHADILLELANRGGVKGDRHGVHRIHNQAADTGYCDRHPSPEG